MRKSKATFSENGSRDTGSGSEGSYSVGYGKPPEHTRFKRGKSGNPKGRPKNSRNFKTILKEVLNEPVEIRQGHRTSKVCAFEALIRATTNRAMKGDGKDLGSLVTFLRSYGLADEESEQEEQHLSASDQQILSDFMRRHGPQLMAASSRHS